MKNIKNTVKMALVILAYIVGFVLIFYMLGDAWDREYEYQQLKEQSELQYIEEDRFK